MSFLMLGDENLLSCVKIVSESSFILAYKYLKGVALVLSHEVCVR